jgi:hypothetical protein
LFILLHERFVSLYIAALGTRDQVLLFVQRRLPGPIGYIYYTTVEADWFPAALASNLCKPASFDGLRMLA